MLACLIFAVVVNIRKKAGDLNPTVTNSSTANSFANTGVQPQQLLVDSVVQAGSALYRICLMVVLFGIGIHILEFIGIMQLLPNWFYPFLEITSCINLRASPAVVAALTSMGGVCVLFQISAITGGRINLRKFILARIPIAVLSAVICHIITRTIAVTAVTNSYRVISSEYGVIASVCLLIMALILIKTMSCEQPPK